MQDVLLTKAKRARSWLKTAYYHQWHRRAAAQALLLLAQSGCKLPPKARKLGDEYAADVLGWRGYAPWLHVYAAARGHFVEGWIPDNYYGAVVLPAVNGIYGETLSKMRFVNRMLFASDTGNLDVVGVVNGAHIDPAAGLLSPAEAHARLLRQPRGVIFKKDFSSQGAALTVIAQADVATIDMGLFNNGVFQRLVAQAPALEEFVRGPVATLRLTTVRDATGTISVRGAFLRLARKGEIGVHAKSAIDIAVDPVSGRLAPEGYVKDWLRVDAHPDTGTRFEGRSVPGYDACCSFVRDLHSRVSYVQCVGWDLAIDPDERPWLLEWNGGHNDIKFSEAFQGPCFADLQWHMLWQKKPLPVGSTH